jgi:methylamine---glutamate N-methyltransferase subunit C
MAQEAQTPEAFAEPVAIVSVDDLADREPFGVALFGDELVVVRDADSVSVLSGRCLHRGARLADGRVVGDDLICSLHGWDYRIETGISAYDHTQCLHRYAVALVDGAVVVDGQEVRAQRTRHPMVEVTVTPVSLGGGEVVTDEYEWHYNNVHNDTLEEPHVGEIHALARDGLESTGHHGPLARPWNAHAAAVRTQPARSRCARAASQRRGGDDRAAGVRSAGAPC